MKVVCKRSILTIVTNAYHKEIVEEWGARVEILGSLIVPDGNSARKTMDDHQTIVVISTFAEDEPIQEIFEAVVRFPSVVFYMTGDFRIADYWLKKEKPANVRFTGFLDKEEYISLVKSVDGAMVLVTTDHTMQRGAYEAMSWGTPIITSDWPILRGTFPRGAVFVDLKMEKENEWTLRIGQMKKGIDLLDRVTQ
jgi:glycosyltransferase involved in cell wall biosynthesis